MELDEKREILTSLESGREALAASLKGVSEEEAVRCPAPDRWSILQCVEHVAVVEDYLFGQIRTAAASDIPTTNLRREEAIRARGADRTRRVAVPAEGQPTGRFATLAAALGHFLESRARTIQFVEGCGEDLRSQVTTHPILGPVNCQETLLMMAAHPLRHAGQIAEIRMQLRQ